jgi:plasmid stabilization system protein ParE
MKIRYEARDLRHVESIHRRIADDDPAAARRVILRIEHSIFPVGTSPVFCRPGVVAGTRILVVPGLPYVAIYRVRGRFADILAVLHTARRRRS